MAFDTKYRPRTYEEVLGQGTTVSILKKYVSEGKGFHQSYVFCGQHGSGKTTLARILARALLCHQPVEGAPCDECKSCLSLLNGQGHECFEELDAATKSGKDDLSRIIEDANYSTLSGSRRVYIIDESHRLSKSALDVLLKPMEDSIPGSEDKRLIILFCTTEPDKMVGTVFSRCAPAFTIRPSSFEDIAGRLATICGLEGIKCEPTALLTLAEISKSHIRDALKTLEGVSVVSGGIVDDKAVSSYFKFDTNEVILNLLREIILGNKLECFELAESVSQDLGPKVSYERLSEASMLAYRASLGIPPKRTSWDLQKLSEMGVNHQQDLLEVAKHFSAPPNRSSNSSFVLDCVGFTPHVNTSPEPKKSISPEEGKKEEDKNPEKLVEYKKRQESHPSVNSGGVYIEPKAVKKIENGEGGYDTLTTPVVNTGSLDRITFTKLLQVHLGGINVNARGRVLDSS